MALAGVENVAKMRREFEDAVEKPLLNYGSGKSTQATNERTRDYEMDLFRQASGRM